MKIVLENILGTRLVNNFKPSILRGQVHTYQ